MRVPLWLAFALLAPLAVVAACGTDRSSSAERLDGATPLDAAADVGPVVAADGGAAYRDSPNGGADGGAGGDGAPIGDAGADVAEAGCPCTATPPSRAFCVGTRCKIVLATTGNPTGLAVDGTYVYWTDYDGKVRRVQKGGGAPDTLVSGEEGPQAVVADDANLYWADLGAADGGSVRQMSKDGGAPESIATMIDQPNAVAVDSANVYYCGLGGDVGRVTKGGGGAISIATKRGQPRRLAVDATNVYWTEYNANLVESAPIGGPGDAGPTFIAMGDGPESIAVDSANVFWANLDGDTLFSASISGGGGTSLVAGFTGGVSLSSIALDGDRIYFTDGLGGSVSSVAKTGGTVTLLSSLGDMGAAHVAVDETSAYWTDSSGDVCSVTPK